MEKQTASQTCIKVGKTWSRNNSIIIFIILALQTMAV